LFIYFAFRAVTEDQILTTTYFGWAAVGIMSVGKITFGTVFGSFHFHINLPHLCPFIVVLKFVYGWWVMFLDQYRSSYSAVGDDQGINYSDVTSRSAYIPQVFSGLFSYPLIACNTDKIDEELYDWT
jgi:hypothetical protein